MTRTLLIAGLITLAACGRQEAAAENQVADAPVDQEAERAVPMLEGSWTVATLDGRPVGQASAMTATFSGGKVVAASGCLRRAWTYTQKRNVVSFTADPGGSANCGGRSPSSEQETAYAALEQASIVIFSKDGSQATLSGTGGNVGLHR